MSVSEDLRRYFPKEKIKSRWIDRVAYASDAGFYHLVPEVVVQPETPEEVIQLFSYCNTHKVPITFRAGGTSLSGQAITNGILADISKYWRKVEILDQGNFIRVEPGVIGSWANAYLKPYQRKIGPDPSSIASAMMGGILSNNSSGMCCGVAQNSYHTLQHINFILPNGSTYNTALPEDYHRFSEAEKPLYEGLLDLKNELEADKELVQMIRAKYLTKNTVGYALNAFLDYTHPLDIFAHLLIGAEGTLGFISHAVLKTVPEYPHKCTAFLYFTDIYHACNAILPLSESGAKALEIMDYASLKSIENTSGAPEIIRNLPSGAAALLVEYQELSATEVAHRMQLFNELIPALNLLEPPNPTTDPYLQNIYWKLRKGMFPSVGAVRKQGTTVILEDVAFPVTKLAHAVSDLHQLFAKYHYNDAIIFGHAKDGNLHFVITQGFDKESEVKRYDAFIKEVVQMVVHKHGGALKAEHGTGRNMAPFVETEWGEKAYRIMKTLKNLVDPNNILNPDVIISNDSSVHVQNLKKLPVVEPEVDKCIECGYCEHKCPSKDLTLSPRRRIVVRRALASLKNSREQKLHKTLLREFQYDGLDTCAVDGMCATDCPVDINTGDLVKRLRAEKHNPVANAIALFIAKNFGIFSKIILCILRVSVGINQIFGKNTMYALTGAVKKLIPTFPQWSNQIKPTALRHKNIIPEKPIQTVVYFAACINRMMGGACSGSDDVMQTFFDVAHKANIKVLVPKKLSTMCCGQAFSSKGYVAAARYSAENAINLLWNLSDQGKNPVVMDLSSCTYTLLQSAKSVGQESAQKLRAMQILDVVDFVYEIVLKNVSVKNKISNVALHPVCSLYKLGNSKSFENAAKILADNVYIPVHAGCCGMAGDRGFLYPELTKSAAEMEKNELKAKRYDGYYCSSKTCEISLSEQTQLNFESILYLANRAL